MTPNGVNVKHPDKLFINGIWVAPHSGRSIEVVDPNSEQVTAVVAEGDEADMDAAVAAARDAFDNGPWGRMSFAERKPYLMKMLEHLKTREAELATAWTRQMGGLSSFAGPMHMGANMTLAQIFGYGDSFNFVDRPLWHHVVEGRIRAGCRVHGDFEAIA
jgi:aldehyde dehydrogenase (NAD+)